MRIGAWTLHPEEWLLSEGAGRRALQYEIGRPLRVIIGIHAGLLPLGAHRLR
jgi:hypothetical protein